MIRHIVFEIHHYRKVALQTAHLSRLFTTTSQIFPNLEYSDSRNSYTLLRLNAMKIYDARAKEGVLVGYDSGNASRELLKESQNIDLKMLNLTREFGKHVYEKT